MDQLKEIVVQKKEMIEKFLCPGCMNGGDTCCGCCEIFDIDTGSFRCNRWYPGTVMSYGTFARKVL